MKIKVRSKIVSIILFFSLAVVILAAKNYGAELVSTAPAYANGDTCTDTDGGINYYVKGYVDTTSSGSTGHYNDLCWNGGNDLHEWSCNGTDPVKTVYTCPNGCSSGACNVSPTPSVTPIPAPTPTPDPSAITINLDPADSHWVSKSGSSYSDLGDQWEVNGYPTGAGMEIVVNAGTLDPDKQYYLNWNYGGGAWNRLDVLAYTDGLPWTYLYYACSWATSTDCPADQSGKKQILIPKKFNKNLSLKFKPTDGNGDSELIRLFKATTITLNKDSATYTTKCPLILGGEKYQWSDVNGCTSTADITPIPTPTPEPTPNSTLQPTPTPMPTPMPENCLPDGALIKIPDDIKIYVIKKCKKEWIETVEEFQNEGYNWSAIKEYAPQIVSSYSDYLESTAKILRAIGQNKIYKIVENKKLPIPSVSSLENAGISESDVKEVKKTELDKYPTAKLVRAEGDNTVYFVTPNGAKKVIPNPETFNSYGNKWKDVVKVSSEDINILPDAVLVKDRRGKLYKLEDGKKRLIKTTAAFNANRFKTSDVTYSNDIELKAYPDGEPIE